MNITTIHTGVMIATMIFIGIHGGTTRDGDYLLVITLGILGDIITIGLSVIGGIMIIILTGIIPVMFMHTRKTFTEGPSTAGRLISDLAILIG